MTLPTSSEGSSSTTLEYFLSEGKDSSLVLEYIETFKAKSFDMLRQPLNLVLDVYSLLLNY